MRCKFYFVVFKVFIFSLLIVLQVKVWPPSPAIANSIDVRVSQSSDDGEELADGSISLYNSDLALAQENSELPVGIRFQNVDVPRGAHITSANIEFETGETDSEGTHLTIKGEISNNALTFNNIIENISSRIITHATVYWNPIPPWNKAGKIHRTPDLSSIVQEIVGKSGWIRKNAMVFIINGSGRRVAKSFDDKPTAAPMLHIEYIEKDSPFITVDKNTLGNLFYKGNNSAFDNFTILNTGSDTLNYVITNDKAWITCSPERGQLSAGDSVTITVDYDIASMNVGIDEATINVVDPFAPNSPLEIDVSVSVQSLKEIPSCGHIPLYTENLISPAILILLDLSDSMKTLMSISNTGENPRTPDLKTIIQEIIDRPGWKKGNSIAFIITGSGNRTVESYDGTSASAPLLHIEYMNSGKDEEIDIRISHSSDDAEEKSTGSVFLTSTDLELVNDMGSDQTIGIRFQNIQVPKNAVITNAFIEFVVDESRDEPTSLTIRAEAHDSPPTFSGSNGNISNRTLTHAYVYWNDIPEWTASMKQSRIDIAKSAINNMVVDKSISWGYGTWCSRESIGYNSTIEYTKINVGCKSHDPDHQRKLQNSIRSTINHAYAKTPFVNSINAAKKYFLGQKKDKDGIGDYFNDIACQPKFMINITDGLGNAGSGDRFIRQYIKDLCDAGVTPIVVGFGLNDALQIQTMARVSNEFARSSNDLYALHEELNGVVQPFWANNQNTLIETLSKITETIKAQIFHGSAPVITTSSDHGDIVVLAEFDATDWSGDLIAFKHNNKNRAWNSIVWKASEKMPIVRKIFTVDPLSTNNVILYTDSVLDNDNWLCKDIGDIVSSKPIVVGNPPFYYPFDGYEKWKKSVIRDPIVYVGANDGALHAFKLLDGVEQWAFFPRSSHGKLNMANDPIYDLCSDDYCHQYFVNGSPQVGDIFTGTSWMTLLVCGLREGGEAYFALDITHSRTFDENGGAEYLWEFTDSELGQTWSEPGIERVKNDKDTAWGIFFGSGYSITDQDNKEAYLYGILAHNKAPLWNDGSNDINRIRLSSTTLKDDALSAPLIADLDADYTGDRIYIGNLYGTMYRIVNIGKGECPMVSKLFDFSHKAHTNPIRAKASYAYGEDDGCIWVYFGTGKYEIQSDKTSTAQQYFFGLKDTITSYPEYSLNKLARLYVAEMKYKNPETHEMQPVRIIKGENDSKKSWILLFESSSPELLGSERVIEQPLVVADIIFFSTFIPDKNICSGNGDTWIYALQYETGLPPLTPVFDLNGDRIFDDKDRITDEYGAKHNIAAINVGSGLGSKPAFYKDTLFVTTTNKNVVSIKVNLPESMATLTSWKDNTI